TKKVPPPINLLLQLENPIEKSLSRRRTARDINVNWDYPITSTDYRVGVMVIPTSICAAPH
ncbi:hypothetical protein TorRG33x02_080480, partial [Trema orientale]